MKPYVLFMIAALLLPRMGFAEDFGKTAVATALIAQAKSGSNENDRPVERVVSKTEHTPYEIQETMPANLDELMARVTEQNAAIVQEYESLLQKDPLNAQAPHWLGQIAEFHWQMAHYDYLRARRAWMAQLESCDLDAGTCPPEPQADYHQAIDDYRKILLQYPTYEKTDDVLFRLGDALIRNQQAKEGIGYLHRLTQTYPNYSEIDAAYLAMGEFYFSQKNTGTAQAAYTKIVETWPQSKFYRYAQYKLAWTYLNLADEESYRIAIQLFKDVVESIPMDKKSADGQIDENALDVGVVTFRNQALNDLSATYAELQDGWKEARDYLKQMLPPDKARAKLIQLAAILDGQAKYEESIELYQELITENHLLPDVPDLMKRQINAYELSNRLPEAQDARKNMIYAMLPDQAWASANTPERKQKMDKENASMIYQWAMKLLIAASETNSKEIQLNHYAEAETWLSLYLNYYPNAERAFDVTFSHAFVMDEQSDDALTQLRKTAKGEDFYTKSRTLLPKLEATAKEYQKIIDWNATDDDMREQVKVAANRQVFVYANILATEDPSWSVVNSAKAQSFVEEKRNSATLDEVPLTPPEAAFVRSAEQFATRYPKDDETPAFLWRAAEIYRTKYHYNQAAERFDAIITHFPDHQYAAVSVGSMFELYNKAHNYEKIEFWAAWLIDKKNFKHYTQKELEEAAAYAMDQQATAYAEKSNFDQAGNTIMRIQTTYPHRNDLVVPASFKAIRYAEEDKNFVLALHRAEELEKCTLTKLEHAHLMFVSGENNVRLARFEDAANAFASSASSYYDEMAKSTLPTPKTDKKSSKNAKNTTPPPSPTLDENSRIEAARAALFAAQIYASLQNNNACLAVIDAYKDTNVDGQLDLYRQGENFILKPTEDAAQNATLLLNNTRATLVAITLQSPDEARQRLENALGTKPDLKIEENRQLAFALFELATDNDWSDLAEKLAKSFNAPELGMSSYEQARATYLDARRIQRDFERVTLEFPVRTLKKKIEEKAKLRQNAEKLYRKAIGFKNAHISTAAAYQLAQMALHFRDAFRALPMPKELENDPDAQDEYTMWLEDELIYPAEDAAAQLLTYAQTVAQQLGAHTPFALKTAQSISVLQPDAWPLATPSKITDSSAQ